VVGLSQLVDTSAGRNGPSLRLFDKSLFDFSMPRLSFEYIVAVDALELFECTELDLVPNGERLPGNGGSFREDI
jgi:hypothetical protein